MARGDRDNRYRVVRVWARIGIHTLIQGVLMGDKSPKNKDRAKKQAKVTKDKEKAKADVLVAAAATKGK